ncbi:MAG TPA: hypothetical protein VKH34_07855 [Vicinamibacterales bacterium]|nr:hypothetical protein [Vicinamibacterales bacterium]
MARIARFSTALCAAILAACGAVSTPEIALDLANPKQPSVIVRGLSRGDLGALTRAELTPERWASVLRVGVGADAPPMAGAYAVRDGALRFVPMFPLDPGRPYTVTFDPSAVPGLGASEKVTAVLSLPMAAQTAPVSVAAVYPTGPTVPANLLRMYVEFSGPMGTRPGQDYIKVIGADGAEIPGALLPLDTELWNGEHTRFTILFDPGRVKRGILPNRAMGRPLEPGTTFTIAIAGTWPDAHSRPLASEFRKTYRVGPAIEAPLATPAWQTTPPPAGSREPLRLTFPAALDHGLLQRALRVVRGNAAVAGVITVAGGETEWRFVPDAAWTAGDYAIEILPVLEDPAGNRIGHAFESVDPDDDTRAAPVRLPFTVR